VLSIELQVFPISRRSLIAIPLVSLLVAFGCVRRHPSQPFARTQSDLSIDERTRTQRININTASADELEKLPGIGKALAERIIEHREKFGPFRRPEHLIIVRGISDKRFRALQDMITVE
jgi:competence ComEA-like helix-hairpin-helix protein